MLSDLANFLLAPSLMRSPTRSGYLKHLTAFLTPLTHFLGEVAVAVGILAGSSCPHGHHGPPTYWAFHWVWHNAAAGETFAVPLVISVFLFLTFHWGSDSTSRRSSRRSRRYRKPTRSPLRTRRLHRGLSPGEPLRLRGICEASASPSRAKRRRPERQKAPPVFGEAAMGNALVPVNRALARRILAPQPSLGRALPMP